MSYPPYRIHIRQKLNYNLRWFIGGLLLAWGVMFTCALSPTVASESSISINLRAIAIRDILRMIGQYGGKSVIFSEDIQGETSVDLQQVQWREALKIVTANHHLVYRERGNIITIMTKDEAAAQGLKVLETRVFTAKYVSISELVKSLKSSGVFSAKSQYDLSSNSNSLIVTDTLEYLQALAHLFKQLDHPSHRILIEARIVSVDESWGRELGLDTVLLPAEEHAGPRIKLNHEYKSGQGKLLLGRLGQSLDLQLAALERYGRGQVLSRPQLVTDNLQPAYIEAGSEIPYQERSKHGTSVAFKKAVLSLKVTPELVAKDRLNLTLELNQDKVGGAMINGVPTIDTRRVLTRVTVRNQETIVLGGIYEWGQQRGSRGLPILQKLPVLGWFFRRESTSLERRKLLIFVTTKLIKWS